MKLLQKASMDAVRATEIPRTTRHVYLDRRECSEYMNVSEKFLATHLHDGPPRLQVGRKVLYRLHDVENWLRQKEVA